MLREWLSRGLQRLRLAGPVPLLSSGDRSRRRSRRRGATSNQFCGGSPRGSPFAISAAAASPRKVSVTPPSPSFTSPALISASQCRSGIVPLREVPTLHREARSSSLKFFSFSRAAAWPARCRSSSVTISGHLHYGQARWPRGRWPRRQARQPRRQAFSISQDCRRRHVAPRGAVEFVAAFRRCSL